MLAPVGDQRSPAAAQAPPALPEPALQTLHGSLTEPPLQTLHGLLFPHSNKSCGPATCTALDAGTSSGKFGPIIGTTSQWFPKDAPGKFKNAVSLFGGALRLELSAKHSTGKGHKVTVEFEKVNAFFAGIPVRAALTAHPRRNKRGQSGSTCECGSLPWWQHLLTRHWLTQIVEKPFPEGSKGFWNMLYADEGLRIFTTNQGNCFVMHNPDAGQKTYSNWRRFDKRALS